jgi:hypothetical protein
MSREDAMAGKRTRGDKALAGRKTFGDRALWKLIDAIEATGGVRRDEKGFMAPVADGDWIDLGEAYLMACEAVGKEPKVAMDGDW